MAEKQAATNRRRSDKCSDCGTSEYDQRMLSSYMPRILASNKEVKRAYAEKAKTDAEMRLMQIDHAEQMAWLQSKVTRQREVIKRLEDRVRSLGGLPYPAPSDTPEATP